MFFEREFLLAEKKIIMGAKKTIVSKRPRASLSTEFNQTQFISTQAEAHFHSSITKKSGIKERGFELDRENLRTVSFY